MRADLLVAIADLLDTLPPDGDATTPKFDLEYWSGPAPDPMRPSSSFCGTSACAIGHAILAGLLPDLLMVRQTLPWKTVVKPDDIPTVSDVVILSRDDFDAGAPHHPPALYVARALDITQDNVEFLFYPSAYEAEFGHNNPPPSVVATRIRRFVAAGFAAHKEPV